jgi:glycosyltransferase involved in cell wall biosynthesis
MRIGVFVVAYNAESTLAQVLQRIPTNVAEKVDEVFVFDDFSTDRTFEVGLEQMSAAHGAKLVMKRNERNLMYGGNQKAGYHYAIEQGFDIVVLLHGDGQYAPEVMNRLLEPLEAGAADMVMGSRMLEPGAARRGNMPMYKYYGNKVLTIVQNLLLGRRLSEFHSGYRAYSVAALRTLPLDRLTDDWHFDTQIILEFLRRDLRLSEVPIPTYYGDEICRVNGIRYAFNCVRVTAAFALSSWINSIRGVRASSRSAK